MGRSRDVKGDQIREMGIKKIIFADEEDKEASEYIKNELTG